MNIGVIGVGNIFGQYVEGLAAFPSEHLFAVADMDVARAQDVANKYSISRAVCVDELLYDSEIDIIINLTVPLAHYEVSTRILECGKHLYSEKPLATTFAEGRVLMELAASKGKMVGCAPDTFLGPAHQTCRSLIDSGAIGDPVAGTGFMVGHGPEGWHPNPNFYYQKGGGPMLDMGPYYLTALINMLGPIRSVSAVTKRSFETRQAPNHTIPVEVQTHAAGTLEFCSGAVVSLIQSFDVWAHRLPIIEIYGSRGSLSVPDPNGFTGEPSVWTEAEQEWKPVPNESAGFCGRGMGVADLAAAVRTGGAVRASGAMGLHVLEAMEAFDLSSSSGRRVDLTTTCDRPAAY